MRQRGELNCTHYSLIKTRRRQIKKRQFFKSASKNNLDYSFEMFLPIFSHKFFLYIQTIWRAAHIANSKVILFLFLL